MKIKLKRCLLRISGEDAKNFLQGQFTNDITKIKPNEIQVNAYCQHQGKIMSLLWVFMKHNSFFISFPEDLKELVLSKLRMFKLMSQVEIEDLSKMVHQYGLIKEDNLDSYKINDTLSLLTSSELITDSHDISQWELACIKECLPEIYLSISEKHIPQALNLDINQFGVSFTKGCYPGQEVVARMHYLGKPKRRLFRFQTKFKVSIGDSLNTNDSKSMKSSGQVIRVVNEGHVFHFLGVFEINNINDGIYLNNDENKSVKLVHE